jgi:hypothetical protein
MELANSWKDENTLEKINIKTGFFFFIAKSNYTKNLIYTNHLIYNYDIFSKVTQYNHKWKSIVVKLDHV